MGKSAMPHGGNDRVYTPDFLAEQIVQHFRPSGSILECARGGGAFMRAIKKHTGTDPEWCEVDQAMLAPGEEPRDFLTFDFGKKFDWIVSNPPYSLNLKFIKRALATSDNVLFLIAATVPFFTSKERAVYDAGFGLKATRRYPFPDEWLKKNGGPGKFGTGIAAVHWQRGWTGKPDRTFALGWHKGFTTVDIVRAVAAGIVGIMALWKLGKWLNWW